MIVTIGAGHTSSGAGYGSVGILRESIEARRVASELLVLFRRKGHTAVNCTVNTASSVNAYLKEQTKRANASNAELFICIHFNASNGKGNGTECYTWKGEQTKISKDICKNLSELGFKNRGVKDGSGLYVIRNTKMNAILVEVAFIDNNEDMEIYNNVGAKKIAEAIYRAIVS